MNERIAFATLIFLICIGCLAWTFHNMKKKLDLKTYLFKSIIEKR